VAVVAGDGHTCALTSGGEVKCWGWNASGQLGDGTNDDSSIPIKVSGLSSGVRSISAGGDNACAVTSAGSAKCWGLNLSGQLGDGTTTDSSSIPVEVSGLSSVRAISTGNVDSCAVTSPGGAVCWGANESGQLGDGTTTDSSIPVKVSGLSSGVRAISAGGSFACALTTNGGVKCWGSNDSGQLGDGTNNDSSIPVAVSRLASGVRAIAVGGYHACALTRAGGVRCWGGDESSTPVSVAGLASGVRAISAGFGFTCALKTSGRVKCWGSNDYGQLGDGSRVNRRRPVTVYGLAGAVRAIAAGQDHTCALVSGGRIECWGRNDFGQLGDRTTATRSSTPMGVVGFGSRGLPKCVVPNVHGRLFADARTAIAKRACQLGMVRLGYSPKLKFGRVIAQHPRARVRAPRGTRIDLTLSRGRKR